MKILKKGFSLAELLIAMGIVSVIATMGFTIAKQGLERAYDTYIYTGYQGLAVAIGHNIGRNITMDTVDLSGFVGEIANTLDAKSTNGVILAPNGVSYKFSQLPTVSNKRYYAIEMKVPKAVQKNGPKKHTICLNYAPDEPWGVLVPLDTTACTSTLENIADRGDLLPFFIDDGKVGRRVPPDYKYNKRTYSTAREALCKAFGNTIKISTTSLSCSGVTGVGGSSGTVRLGNPRKAH